MLIRFSPHPASGAAPLRLRRSSQDRRQPAGFFRSLPTFEMAVFAAIGLLLALA